MAVEVLDLDGFLKFLKDKQGVQSDKQFAQRLGVSPSYLCDVYNGRRVPGESITGALNARRSVVFHVESEGDDESANKSGKKGKR